MFYYHVISSLEYNLITYNINIIVKKACYNFDTAFSSWSQSSNVLIIYLNELSLPEWRIISLHWKVYRLTELWRAQSVGFSVRTWTVGLTENRVENAWK